MKVREKKRLCRLKTVEKLPGFEPITIFMQSVNYQYTVTCRNCVCGIAVVKVIQPIRSTKRPSQYWIITVIAVLESGESFKTHIMFHTYNLAAVIVNDLKDKITNLPSTDVSF